MKVLTRNTCFLFKTIFCNYFFTSLRYLNGITVKNEMPLNQLVFYAFAHYIGHTNDSQNFLINDSFFGGCSSAENNSLLATSSPVIVLTDLSPAPQGAILTGLKKDVNKAMHQELLFFFSFFWEREWCLHSQSLPDSLTYKGLSLHCYVLTNWRMLDGDKKAWLKVIGDTAPGGNTSLESQSSLLLGTPVLPNLTIHSEWQKSELQNFYQDAQKRPRGKCKSDNWIFWAYFPLWGSFPPRTEYGWTRLIRIQTNESTSPTQLFLLFLHMVSFATTSDNQISFFCPSDPTPLK